MSWVCQSYTCGIHRVPALWRVTFFFEEIGADFQATLLDVYNGLPEAFRSINAKFRVPVLSIDDEIITESPAIFTAISQLSPKLCLMGRNDLEVVRVYEWLNWISGTLHSQAFGGLFRPQRFCDHSSVHDLIRTKSATTAEECFKLIEDRLTGTFAIGNHFTAVDPFLYVFFRWGVIEGMIAEEKYPQFTKLAESITRRDSVKKVLGREQIPSCVSE